MTWKEYKTVLYHLGTPVSIDAPIASFDMDHTLIKPKDGRKFPRDADDWEWNTSNPDMKKYLNCVSEKGYHILIISNQSGISSGKTDKKEIMTKVDCIIKKLDLKNNISVFIATKSDIFRKPSRLIMDFAISSLNLNKNDLSFYCGDAAGRLKYSNIKKDFSCSDRKFASNCNLAFFTPEELFRIHDLDSKTWEWGGIHPAELLKEYSSESGLEELKETLPSSFQEMIIMIGSPASGKSTISKRIGTYKNINQDELKTKVKCLKMCNKYLKEGHSVVVDRTNPRISDRKDFIDLAKKFNTVVRCVWVVTSPDMCEHLNMYRAQISKGERDPVPIIAMRIFRKNLEEPSIKEGFSNIFKVKPKIEFKSAYERSMFLQWY